MPLIVRTSAFVLPLTLNVTVICDAVTLIVGRFGPVAVTSLPFTADTLPMPALNFHPDGASSFSVTPLCGVGKALFAPSVRTMFGRVVNAGDVAFAAVSALADVVPGV